MEEKITDKQIRIKCRFHILSIHKFSIHARYGEHTHAEITAVVEGDKARAALPDTADEEVTIICGDNDTTMEEILFSGVVETAEALLQHYLQKMRMVQENTIMRIVTAPIRSITGIITMR